MQSPPIRLIAIPEIPTLLPLDEVKEFIISEAEKIGFHISSKIIEKTIDLSGIYSSGAIEAMNELQNIASEKTDHAFLRHI